MVKQKIAKVFFIISLCLSVLVLVDNFLLWKINTPEILESYIEGSDASGSVDKTCLLVAASQKRYYVPYYVYCGINIGDTFWVSQTPVFRHGITIKHTFKGNTYTDNIRMLNFAYSALFIFSFMIIMLVFDFFYPQFLIVRIPNCIYLQQFLQLLYLAFITISICDFGQITIALGIIS
jgi:hypothetical protein